MMNRYTTALLRGFFVFCVRRARGRDSKGLWRADGREAASLPQAQRRASQPSERGHRALAGGPTGRIGIAVSLGRSVKAKVEVIVSYRSSALTPSRSNASSHKHLRFRDVASALFARAKTQ